MSIYKISPKDKKASLYFLSFLFFIIIACASKAATEEDIQKARHLSTEGMKIIEGWGGKKEDLEKANSLFKEALSLNPNCVEAYTGIGRSSLRGGLISGFKYEKKALESALSYADKAISIDNSYIKAHKLKGRVLTLIGKYDEAFKEADMIEKIDSSSCEHIDLRGGIYEVRGNIGDAITEFKKELFCNSLEDNKKSGLYDGVADLYFRNKDYDNSILYYEKAIELAPNSAWLYGNYSRVLTAKGDLDKAEEMVKKAISIMDYGMAHVYLSRIYYERGEIYLNENNMEKAENEFLLASSEYPEDKYAHYKLAYIQAKKGNCDKAIKISEDILRLDPNDTTAKEMILYCKNNCKELKQ